MSTKAIFPNKFNSEYEVNAKAFRIYTEHQRLTFLEEFLYVSLYTEEEEVVNILCKFGVEK